MQNTIQRVVVLRGHLPEQMQHAKELSSSGKKVLLHAEQATSEIAELSKNPLVQVRFGKPDNLTYDASLIIQ